MDALQQIWITSKEFTVDSLLHVSLASLLMFDEEIFGS